MGTDARAGEAHAVVEEGDEGSQEGGGAGGGEEGAAESAGIGVADYEGEVQREVGGEGPAEGAGEADHGVVLATGAGAHVDELAGEGDATRRVAPGAGHAVVGAHGAEERGVARVFAVEDGAVVAALEGFDEPGVDGGRGADPFVVGTW